MHSSRFITLRSRDHFPAEHKLHIFYKATVQLPTCAQGELLFKRPATRQPTAVFRHYLGYTSHLDGERFHIQNVVFKLKSIDLDRAKVTNVYLMTECCMLISPYTHSLHPVSLSHVMFLK